MRVTTEELRAELGGTGILHGVDIDVHSGEFVGIIGPNGSGKSTLLKCIYRVLQPSAGVISLDSAPLDSLKTRESAKRIAVVSQHNPVGFDFTVLDMVLMGRSPHKNAMERDNAEDYRIVREAIETVGLAGMEERIFTTLSGGERQRVILAQALAQQTPCLVLDEPTNHLDIKYQLQLMDIVKGLGVTVVAAIHDLNIAAEYCDRLYALVDGEIIAEGVPEEVLTPKWIRRIYEVDSQIIRDERGRIHVLYYSGHGEPPEKEGEL
ncbi:MAG: ABC transporter ATP-binding protein [Oscillospiraceae bacterium]